MLWVSPKVDLRRRLPARRSCSATARPARTLDLRGPTSCRSSSRGCAALVALGIDGVKGDRGDEVDLEATPDAQNVYPLLFARRDAVRRAAAGVRARSSAPATMGSQAVLPRPLGRRPARRASIGLQRGDPRRRRRAAMSGFPTWGSDVGGYSVGGADAGGLRRAGRSSARSRRCSRSADAARTRRRGRSAPRRWRALRDAAILHYELFPYLYGLLAARRAGAAAARLRSSRDDPRPWERRPRAARRPRPARGAGRRPRHVAERLPAGGRLGRPLHRRARARRHARSRARRRCGSSRSTLRRGAAIPFNLRDRSWTRGGASTSSTAPGRTGWLTRRSRRVALRASRRRRSGRR